MSPLRSDGSRDDQAGEAGPVEQSSAEAKSLKLRAKGLSGCQHSGQQLRQPDRGLEGKIKNHSHDILLKETELKGTVARDFWPLVFFHESTTYGPLIHTLKQFRILV